MKSRKDALIAVSKFTIEVNRKMKDLGGGITGTVGMMNVSPNSHQFVPEFVEMSIEIRTMDKELVDRINLREEFLKEIESIEAETNVKIELEERARIGYSNPTPPSIMNQENISIMKEGWEELGYHHMIINKGTGHDAMIMSAFVPTNMIYVPSKIGRASCRERV